MRTITMQTIKDGKLEGEILEGGKYWQIEQGLQGNGLNQDVSGL